LITPTKEIVMLRTFAVAAILALAVSSAQAEDSLVSRVHDAAVKACAVEASNSLPASHYATISAHCVDRISAAALSAIRARDAAKTASN
jgi:hypothetical protein